MINILLHQHHGHSHHDHHHHEHSHHEHHHHSHEDHEHHHHHHHHHEAEISQYNQYISYIISYFGELNPIESSLIATAIVSIIPIFIFVVMNTKRVKTSTFFISFAVGGLLGDAFLHLLPHSFVSHSHGENTHLDHHNHHHDPHDHHHHQHDAHDHHHHQHDHSEELNIGLWILAGYILFFILETIARVKGGHNHSHHGHNHSPKEGSKILKDSDDQKLSKILKGEKDPEEKYSKKKNDEHVGLKIGAILNMIADIAHNFTDGLTISAAFYSSTQLGLSTTLAIFIHEIPHEIGDFALLIKSGISKKKAILIQFLTAIGAFAGTIVGIISHEKELYVDWILPLTAGGFIYVASVNILPDLLKDTSIKKLFMQLFAIGLGVGLMVVIALYE